MTRSRILLFLGLLVYIALATVFYQKQVYLYFSGMIWFGLFIVTREIIQWRKRRQWRKAEERRFTV